MPLSDAGVLSADAVGPWRTQRAQLTVSTVRPIGPRLVPISTATSDGSTPSRQPRLRDRLCGRGERQLRGAIQSPRVAQRSPGQHRIRRAAGRDRLIEARQLQPLPGRTTTQRHVEQLARARCAGTQRTQAGDHDRVVERCPAHARSGPSNALTSKRQSLFRASRSDRQQLAYNMGQRRSVVLGREDGVGHGRAHVDGETPRSVDAYEHGHDRRLGQAREAERRRRQRSEAPA